ncbi:HD domain-containing phosphohydrolase [Alishewanella sp. SMS8]|uniref:HD domain-containing phosphohydrolase n=1 Tax=Alishewanella sp. SMS8 TaxID=2994676 RepID=UPI002741B442|nr:HD domain-containing phosphohydrolase [Alishewanella sp. SMS8]MDP5458016.1 response regulator [Alishewanella sp. SMS8]
MNQQETASLPVILCVDDELNILKSLTRLFLSKPVKLLRASSGQEALALLEKEKVNLIISDMRMPNMTGAEFLAQAATLQPDAYRILMTGYADLASTVSAINVGKIHRYVQKPWDNAELLKHVDDGLEMYRLVKANKELTTKIAKQNKQLKELNHSLDEMVQQRTLQLKKTIQQYKKLAETRGNEQKATLEVLYNIISINPALNGKFAQHVAKTCANIAAIMNLSGPEKDLMNKAGLYSELGKLGLPSHCLSTPAYKLDSSERKQFLQHPQLAEEMLAPAVHLHTLSEVIANQFERFNGSGQPLQKVGTDIPIGARILAVARDFWLAVYQQMNSKSYTRTEAFEFIRMQKGTLYDPDVVAALEKLIKNNIDSFDKNIQDGLHVEQIQVGMRLSQNLYNRKHMLLLPKDHIFCDKTLSNLIKYQSKHKEKLLVQVEPFTIKEDSDEE